MGVELYEEINLVSIKSIYVILNFSRKEMVYGDLVLNVSTFVKKTTITQKLVKLEIKLLLILIIINILPTSQKFNELTVESFT